MKIFRKIEQAKYSQAAGKGSLRELFLTQGGQTSSTFETWDIFICLKLLFSALSIILMILFCDYCLQTFLSTSTVSFAPLLLNIASISSCPYLRDNVWIKSSRLYFVFFCISYFVSWNVHVTWSPVWGVSHSCSPAHWSGKISQKLVPCDQLSVSEIISKNEDLLTSQCIGSTIYEYLGILFPASHCSSQHKQHQILHQQHNGSNISSRKTKR